MASDVSYIAVDGRPLTAESEKMMEYVHTRSRELSAAEICERTRAAAAELEKVIASADERLVRLRPFAGKWHMADVVDHISQTQIRGAEELRHLLAGRRPPGPPVYEALKSGASDWAPWQTLVGGLHDANVEMIAILEGAARDEERRASGENSDAPTVLTLMVATTKMPNDELVAQLWFAELKWKEYALLQRLHLLDHRTQMRKLIAACVGGASGAAS
ncbi:MAG TPA: DinB family protein [Candidatus Acidoferrum sp.]|nr:DinB family protein [Candidatus Acidoferrum sp.]